MDAKQTNQQTLSGTIDDPILKSNYFVRVIVGCRDGTAVEGSSQISIWTNSAESKATGIARRQRL
jgi:hypothetical protein